MKPIRIALCQICPTGDYDRNIKCALDMIEKAAGGGADLVSLPELFYYPYDIAGLKKLGDQSRLVDRLARAAEQNQVYLCIGSVAINGPSGMHNSSLLIGKSGEILHSYSKCHLFEMRIKETVVRESALFYAGDRVSPVKTELGTIGILICYDIRFPEMARKLALDGAELILVPAVFNRLTGPAHWHLMNRARAVENQLFIAAAAQGFSRESQVPGYGHSLVVGPWGDILAEAGEEEEIIFADLDPRVLEETRKRLPLLKHRRVDVYGE
jgi:omega-amidase